MTEGPAPAPQDELPLHLTALRAFAIVLARDQTLADDLVQETIVRAWKHLDQFQPGTNMRAWLFTILRNVYFSGLRKSRHVVADPDGMFAAREFVRAEHEGRLAFRDFLRAFDQLSPEHREALILVGASGFTYQEASEMTGVAVGTVKSRVNRARAQLAELLNLAPGEDPVRDADASDLSSGMPFGRMM